MRSLSCRTAVVVVGALVLASAAVSPAHASDEVEVFIGRSSDGQPPAAWAAAVRDDLVRIKSEVVSRDRAGLPGADTLYAGYLDAEHNRVVFKATEAPRALRQALVRRYGRTKVAIQVTPGVGAGRPMIGGRYTDRSPYFGGAMFKNDQGTDWCTTGFSWRSGGGYHDILTAGHCFSGLNQWARNYNSSRIGYTTHDNWAASRGTSYGNGDFALIRIPGGTAASQGRIYVFGRYSSDWRNIKEVSTTRPYESVCSSGRMSGEICDWIVEGVEDHRYDNGTVLRGAVVASMTSTSDCIFGGDSGAPVYQVRSDGQVRAKGVLSGGGHAFLTCWMFFSNITDAYNVIPGNIAVY